MGRRILVVDDERSIAETLCRMLETSGYVAVCACSGREALAKAEDFRPDLLLSDVMMPGLDGFETGLLVKKVCPECRLLFFSGSSTIPRTAMRLADRKYRFEVLEKPVPPALLLDKVNAALSAAA